MVQKIISIICYVIAGFFLYAACLMGFINKPPYFIKIVTMSSFAILGLIVLVTGLAIERFKIWKRNGKELTDVHPHKNLRINLDSATTEGFLTSP